MTIASIKSKRDYERMLKRIEALMDVVCIEAVGHLSAYPIEKTSGPYEPTYDPSVLGG